MIDQWISVSDPPAQGIRIIVFSKTLGAREAERTFTGRFYCASLNRLIEDATHWQPLPNPPKQ